VERVRTPRYAGKRYPQTATRAGNDADLTINADRLFRRHEGRLYEKLVQCGCHRHWFRNHGVMASVDLAAAPTRLTRSRRQTPIEVRLRSLDKGARQRRGLRRTQPHWLCERSQRMGFKARGDPLPQRMLG
jgi:hypothetical protein